jgi:dTDP-4-amino-4,6-dideoxygalactose transaminase
LQEAYRDLGYGNGSFPLAEKCAEEILSIPIFPQLRNEEVRMVVELVNGYNDIP